MSTAVMTNKSFGFVSTITKIVLLGGAALMMVAALHPDVRSQVRGSFLKDYRMVVSTASGDLLGNGTKLFVTKVKTQDALFLEIYEPLTAGGQRLVDRIELPDKKDGFFNFNGQATNLVIDDVDGDGRAEILAPSFDKNLVGHLNVYHYNTDSHEFQRLMR
jgi:hypothetical protein